MELQSPLLIALEILELQKDVEDLQMHFLVTDMFAILLMGIVLEMFPYANVKLIQIVMIKMDAQSMFVIPI